MSSLLTSVREAFCGESCAASSPGRNPTAVLVLGVGRELESTDQRPLVRFKRHPPSLWSGKHKNTSREKWENGVILRDLIT